MRVIRTSSINGEEAEDVEPTLHRIRMGATPASSGPLTTCRASRDCARPGKLYAVGVRERVAGSNVPMFVALAVLALLVVAANLIPGDSGAQPRAARSRSRLSPAVKGSVGGTGSAESAVATSTPPAGLTVVTRLPFDGAVAVARSADSLFVLRAEGIATGAGLGWRLDRVDPESGAILGTARGDASPVDVAAGFDSVWVLTGNGAKPGGLGPGLDRLDAVSLAPQARISFQSAGTRIWLTTSTVWLADADGLFGIDPQTNTVARQLPVHHEFVSFASTPDRLLLATRATGSDGQLHVTITWVDAASLQTLQAVDVASSSADAGVPPHVSLAPIDETSVLVGLRSVRDGDSLALVARGVVTGRLLDGGASVAASTPDGLRWAVRDEPAPRGSVTARVSRLQAISADGHVAGVLDGLGLVTCLYARGNLVYACAEDGVVIATR